MNEWNYFVYFIFLADKTFILFSVFIYVHTVPRQDYITRIYLNK